MVGEARSQPEPCTDIATNFLLVRLDGRIIDFADVLVSVRVMLVGGLRNPGGSGVEAPAMVAWTSSSGIRVQAYRADMVAKGLAVKRRRWRRQERGPGYLADAGSVFMRPVNGDF